MIDELRNDLAKIIRRYTGTCNTNSIGYALIYLIYLKYLCEKEIMEYNEITQSNDLDDVFLMPTLFKMMFKNNYILLNSLLRNIVGVKAKDLVLELLKEYEKELIYPINEKKVFYYVRGLLSTFDLSGYDTTGNTIYLYEKNIRYYNYVIFKIFDEILDVHNEYIEIENDAYVKSDILYIYDATPKYNSSDKITSFIRKNIPLFKKVIYCTKYSKISNFKEGRYLIHDLKTVIIKDKNTAMIFENNANEISIINYNNPKIENIEMLNKIIKMNRKQKDILVKTNYKEIRDNNMRIGFHLYQMDKKEDVFDINKVVDENTRILKELNNLNETVEKEINKLFNM